MTHFTLSTRLGVSLHARTDALVALFDCIAQTRMAGVPILNPALRVETFGFELCEDIAASVVAETRFRTKARALELPAALGVLITPWFMNLVWFPLARSDQADGVGCSRLRRVGEECFDFIGGYEPGFGCYEACSLFSPMFEFADPAAARATACAVLDTLRQPLVKASPGAPAHAKPPQLPARRAFLLGRQASAEDSA